MAAVRQYRDWMARYAGMRLIDVWYAQITAGRTIQAEMSRP